MQTHIPIYSSADGAVSSNRADAKPHCSRIFRCCSNITIATRRPKAAEISACRLG